MNAEQYIRKYEPSRQRKNKKGAEGKEFNPG